MLIDCTAIATEVGWWGQTIFPGVGDVGGYYTEKYSIDGSFQAPTKFLEIMFFGWETVLGGLIDFFLCSSKVEPSATLVSLRLFVERLEFNAGQGG